MSLWVFLAYSFFGFLLELAYARLTKSKKPDRKCLLALPLCPVYGLAALGILALPPFVAQNPWLLFLCGGAVAVAVEYNLGFFTRHALGVDFWDYSDLKGNVDGLVCPLFAVFWGLLAVVGRTYLHPLVAPVLETLPGWLGAAAAAALGVDVVTSALLLRRRRDTGCLRWYDRLKIFQVP